MSTASLKRHHRGRTIYFLVAGVLVASIFFAEKIHVACRSYWDRPGLMQVTRQLGLAMNAYAQDHNGQYPDGQSSTEVFQKLLDGGYVYDPDIFFSPWPGKVEPIPGVKTLKPENVSFDCTGGVTSNSPDELPLVFSTGYKVTYSPGAAAVQRDSFHSNLWDYFVGWLRYKIAYPTQSAPLVGDGLSVTSKGNFAAFMKAAKDGKGNRTVPNFVPPHFQPDGKTYRQLTPDGELK